MSVGRVTCPLLCAAALAAAQPYGVSLTTGGIAPASLRYTAPPLWLELRGRAAWQVTPSWTLYRLACHQLLPWLWATFPMVPDAAWRGSDQQPLSTAPATGPMGRLGRPCASDPRGVGRGVLSLCCPWCMCVCGVLAHVARVHRCARCVRCACAVGGCVPVPPPLVFFSVFFALYFFCFVVFFFWLFFRMEKGVRAHCRHRHG